MERKIVIQYTLVQRGSFMVREMVIRAIWDNYADGK